MVLVDGEHYPPVVRSALKSLEDDYGYEVTAAVFIGGLEKITSEGDFHLGCPLIKRDEAEAGLIEAIEKFHPDIVVDLSDEPVVDYEKRFRLASNTLKFGVGYIGSDFRFDPPRFDRILTKPSLGIIGTGKRVGKTAVSGYICRVLDQGGFDPCIVAMGRGGPPEPEVLLGGELDLTPEKLLDFSREGKHAASDYFEDALTSRVTTIGCRRCGGGLAGAPFVSNVQKGAFLVNELSEDFAIMEGSGATLPPVAVNGYLLTVGAGQPVRHIADYFGAYRLLLSDLVVITMAEPPIADDDKVAAIEHAARQINPDAKIVRVVFRPRPLGDIEGKKLFVATTAPPEVKHIIQNHLEEKFKARVVGISGQLSNRKLLKEEMLSALGEVTTVVTELKAAAVDLVTSLGLELGLEVIYLDNEPVTVGGDGGLPDLVLELANISRERYERAEMKSG